MLKSGSTSWMLSTLSVFVLGLVLYSDTGLGVMYGVGECGLFRCRNWLFANPSNNDDCSARVRMTKVAQFSVFISSIFTSLTITTLLLHTLSLPEMIPPFLNKYKTYLHGASAVCNMLACIMIGYWFTSFLCHRQYSSYQDSHVGSAFYFLPVGAIAESVLARNSWKTQSGSSGGKTPTPE